MLRLLIILFALCSISHGKECFIPTHPFASLLFRFHLLNNLIGIDRRAGNKNALNSSVYRPAPQRHSPNYAQRQQNQRYSFVINHEDIFDDLADNHQHRD